MLLIGLCGKMGSGKDYIASKYIIPYLKNLKKTCLQLSFADQIKVNVICKNNIQFNDVFVKKTNDTRMLLQSEGTENGRNLYGEDIWIKYYKSWVQLFESRDIDVIITSDVRFKNEYEYIKSRGGFIIKIHAPHRNEQRLQEECKGNKSIYDKIKNHSSECDLDDIEDNNYDFVIHNDLPIQNELLDKLYDKLRL